MLLQGLFIVLNSFLHVSCHGNMVWPITWHDKEMFIKTEKDGYVYDFAGMKSGMMCVPGRDIKQEEICDPTASQKSCKNVPHPGGVCFWYTNGTRITKPTLFDRKLRTYLKSDDQQNMMTTPWRAPGRAPVFSPCGAAGGNMDGCPGGCEWEVGGYAGGPRANEYLFKHKFHVTNYTRGEDIEVAWGITANHGGGYAYRLCKLPEAGVHQLTEECFQQTYLDFVGDKQWAQYGEDESTRIEFPAVRVNKGTFPEGSTWTKNPIPACAGTLGGFEFPSGECINGFQFPPPAKGLGGYGLNIAHNFPRFQFSIIDKVHIPKNLEKGEYVLSFRWDCEETPQVWSTCASIKLN